MSVLWRYWRQLPKKRRSQVLATMALAGITALLEVASISLVIPFLTILAAPNVAARSPWISDILVSLDLAHPTELLSALGVAFVATILLAGMARIALLYVQVRLSYRLGAELGRQAIDDLLAQPYNFHLQRNLAAVFGSIPERATRVSNSVLLPAIQTPAYVVTALAIISLLAFVNPGLTLGVLGLFGGLYLLMARLTRRILQRSGRDVNHGTSILMSLVQQIAGGIRHIVVGGLQATFSRLYFETDHPFRRAAARIVITKGLPRIIIETLGLASIAALAMISIARSGSLESILPTLGALALGTQRLVPLLQNIFNHWSSIQSGEALLAELLSHRNASPTRSVSDAPIQDPLCFSRELRLDGISFAYSPTQPTVLEQLDLTIPKGARVGLVGPSGSGKSTVMDILLGLLRPQAGVVRVDDRILTDDLMPSWQQKLGHVPQMIYLADSTIAENIAFGVPPDQIDWPLLDTVAAAASLSSLKDQLKDGYHTRLGQDGVRLSGGQRQRIGIARALYRQPELLIFDEATNALDSETEAAINESIQNIDRSITVIIIAHRPSALASCDVVYQLTNKRLVT